MVADRDEVVVSGVTYKLSSRSRRFGAQMLDSWIGLLAMLIIFVALDKTPLVVAPPLAGAAMGTVFIFSLLFQDGLNRGQSLGKKFLKTRVIGLKDGRPCTYVQSFLRNIFLLLPVVNFVDYLFIFRKNIRRLGDLAAGTVVVLENEKMSYSDSEKVWHRKQTLALFAVIFGFFYLGLFLLYLYGESYPKYEILGYPNGDTYRGEWRDDKRNGQGMYYFSSGDNYIGEWRDDKRHGQGTYSYFNGDKYVGEYRDNERNGPGTFYYFNGDKYVGEWRDDNQHGQGIYYDSVGTVLAGGTWKNGEFVSPVAE